MLVRNEVHLHPRLRSLLEGRWARPLRWTVALVFAAVFGGVVAGIAGPVVIPHLPLVAELACPPGHRVTDASTREVRPNGPARRRRPLTRWLACRDGSGQALPSTRPHFAMIQTAWALAALALLPVMIRAVRFVLRTRSSRGGL